MMITKCITAMGECINSECRTAGIYRLVEIPLDDLPDGWGSFDGDFGVCEHCDAPIWVMFDLWPEDLEEVD